MILNPVLLPKVRSETLMDSARGQPCSLRIASFVGLRCSDVTTCVGCHLPVFGRGVATKATDLAVAYGCSVCHDILDGRNQNVKEYIVNNYPAAFIERQLNGLVETHARMVMDGIITVKGMVLV